MTKPIPAEVLQQLDSSYAVVLKSKRLMLQSVIRRLRRQPAEELARTARRLQAEIARTGAIRARIRLTHGDVHDPRFWIDAYALLIQHGEDLAGELRDGQSDAVVDLPLIDGHMELWRERLRDWILAASA